MTTLPLIKTPFTRINNMLGTKAGLERGALCAIAGLEEHYCNKLVEDIRLGIALVNEPARIVSTKTPLILDIQFGITISEYRTNMIKRYREITGDTKSLNYELLHAQGYGNITYVVEDVRNFTLSQLFDYINQLELCNYELHVCAIGDFTKMNRTDENGYPLEFHTMLNRLRGFFNERKCTTIITIPTIPLTEQYAALSPDAQLKCMALLRDQEYRRSPQSLDIEIVLQSTVSQVQMCCTKHRGSFMDFETIEMSKNNVGRLDFDVPFTPAVQQCSNYNAKFDLGARKYRLTSLTDGRSVTVIHED